MFQTIKYYQNQIRTDLIFSLKLFNIIARRGCVLLLEQEKFRLYMPVWK